MKLLKSFPALTPREVEIVRLLRKGYSNKEIAQELGIAVTTVKWNMTNILGKFEVQSSRQLLARLAKLPPDDSREWTIEELCIYHVFQSMYDVYNTTLTIIVMCCII